MALHLVFSPRALAPAALALLALAACGDGTSPGDRQPAFLDGPGGNPEIGIVVNSTSGALTLFQLGSPATQRQVALGPSAAISATGAAVRGRRAAVPLGDAASVAIVDLAGARVDRVFTFPAGNATGAAWVDDTTVVAANFIDDYVGRFTLTQSGASITDTVYVAPAPTAALLVGDRVLVVSGNLAPDYTALGDGVVTAVDPRTMKIVGTVTVGPNPQAAAVGPDGKVYVVNTGDYGSVEGSLSVIDPVRLVVERTVPGFGSGPGSIVIDQAGKAYVSSFNYGTVVWDTKTGQFVRGPGDPLCAPVKNGGCRAAAHATASADGSVYQAFFGTSTLPPAVFVYRGAGYELADSISVGSGPSWIDVRSFR